MEMEEVKANHVMFLFCFLAFILIIKTSVSKYDDDNATNFRNRIVSPNLLYRVAHLHNWPFFVEKSTQIWLVKQGLNSNNI